MYLATARVDTAQAIAVKLAMFSRRLDHKGDWLTEGDQISTFKAQGREYTCGRWQTLDLCETRADESVTRGDILMNHVENVVGCVGAREGQCFANS